MKDNIEEIKLNDITSKLKEFKVEAIEIENGCVNLQIELSQHDNAENLRLLIAARLYPYRSNITFFVNDTSTPKFKKIIAVSSGKGGVGKSTITLHIAFSLKEMGYKVGILDADIYAPSIPTFLNSNEQPMSKDGIHIEPINTHGFQMLSMGLMLKDDQSTLWQDNALGGVFNQFLQQGNWQCEYLLIDLPPGTTSIHTNLSRIAPNASILLVSEPNKIAYVDAIKMYITCRALNMNIAGIVHNKAYFECKNCHHRINYHTKCSINNLKILADLPRFEYFKEFAENGYKENYKQQEERAIFHELTSKLIE